MLVVEDDVAIRSALAVSLRGEGYEVLTKADGAGVFEAVADFRPDAIVLDVRLPGATSGYEIGRMLRRSTDSPLLFLTAADLVSDRLRGFEVGADDYMGKPFDMAELLARVKALLRRAGRLPSGARHVADLILDEQQRVVTRSGQELNLTRKEFDVLLTLMRHPGRVLSKSQLLTQVWGFEGYDVNLVEVHVSALRQKLEAHGPRLIRTVRGVGYVLRG